MTHAGKSEREAVPLSPLKQAFLALEEARARIEELERARTEPIAVIGVGCRIPGGEGGVEGYWQLLREQKCAVRDGVEKRFGETRGETDLGTRLPESARWAALLERVDLFEPQHFGISPREAVGIDPQHRLLLEVVWEALENAAIDPFSVYQSLTGVYLGISTSDYTQLLLNHAGLDAIHPHFASGIGASVASGRISYVLGLNGPSLSVDTACSSSLVAVHLACDALRRGDCSMALAGGVNLILALESSLAYAQAGILSPRGACRTFCAGADGFVRGEGCGVVVLKCLRDAEANGDRILGVILGSAVNQDGATSGLTVPNGQAQRQLLRQALTDAGVEAWQVGYVEAHGTGTALGDPIEAEALGVVFGSGRKRQQPLCIGSVKTNLGHLEAAAGVVGLIKVVLGLEHRTIPGQLHWERLSEHVRWSELPLEVVTECRPWAAIEGRRIGGVSSFGFSGTNAHVVLEAWASGERPPEDPRAAEVLTVTARTEPALRELAKRYAEYLERSEADWAEICYTAATGRGVFAERLAVVAANKAEAAQQLRAWLREEDAVQGVSRGRVRMGARVRVGLVLGRDFERLDGLIRIGPGEERSQAWQKKLHSWGVDPVMTVPADGNAAQALKVAEATVALVLGDAEVGLPAVQVKRGWRSLAGALAELFARGVAIDWKGWEGERRLRRVALPTYAFQRERYWITPQSGNREQIGERTGLPNTADPASWMYRLKWQPEDLAPVAVESNSAGAGQPRRVLLLGTPDQVDGTAVHLRQRGAAVVCASVERADQLLQALSDQHAVAYFASSPEAGETLSPGDVTAQSEKSLRGLLSVTQQILHLPAAHQPRLFVVTQNAYAIADEGAQLRLLETPLTGLANAIALETPTLRCTLIDGDATAPGVLSVQIGDEVLGESEELRVALRSGRRHVARLERLPASELTRAGGKDIAGGVHLITGGLRGIGLRLTEWLVEQGARDLILVGRQPPSPAALESMTNLTAQGAAIRIFQGDIADLATAERAVGAAGSNLRGVWHCAGVLDNEPLAHQSWERIAPVMRPKVDGAWNLHLLTRASKLEFFVLYSSWASLSGSRMQANYCAANAFLDGLANFRKGHGLPALSVNWGVWQGTGVAAAESYQRVLARAGQEPMKPADALAALKVAVHAQEPQLAIAAIHWPRYLSRTASSSSKGPGRNPLYAEVAGATDWNAGLGIGGSSGRKARDAQAQGIAGAVPGIALTDLGTLPGAARKTALLRVVEESARKTLDLDSREEIDPNEPLSELGMDSLLAVELRDRLSGFFAKPFPASLAFDYPTLKDLADFIDREIFSPGSTGKSYATQAETFIAAPFSAKPLSVLDEIEQLSDEEVNALFEKAAVGNGVRRK